MNFKLMALALFSFLILSCNKNETPASLTDITTDQQVTENLRIYEGFENLILDIGQEDLDAMFVYYIGFVQFKATQSDLTMADVEIFEEEYKNVTYTELLPKIAEVDTETAEQLVTFFPRIQRYSDVDDRIYFLKSELEKLEIDQTGEIATYPILMEGYKNMLGFLSTKQDGASRDCVSGCVEMYRYGTMWHYYYNAACQVVSCSNGSFNTYAEEVADEHLAKWCEKKCKKDMCFGITCPPGTKCKNGNCVNNCVGVFCIAGYSCVDGICVEDPWYEECNNYTPCPSGQYCDNGICQPW